MPAELTLAALITQLRDYTNHNSTTLVSATVEVMVNAAVHRLNQDHDWRGQEQNAEAPYSSTADGISVPSGFVKELLIAQQSTTAGVTPSSSRKPINKLVGGRTAWIDQFPRLTTGRDAIFPAIAAPGDSSTPGFFYYLWDEKIFLVPNPSSDVLLSIDYFAWIPDLTLANNPHNFFTRFYPDALRWGALVEVWAFLHEDERATRADALFEKYKGLAVKHDTQTVMSGPPRHRGT